MGTEQEASTRPSPSGAAVAARKKPARSGLPADGDAASAPARHRDGVSRQRVIDAAIRCILELGLYRASSNAIAERAGVTWGVIQHYFGSREALMVEVLNEGTRRLNDILLTAEIDGETVTERVSQYMDILLRYYGSSDYLAFNQVLVNLTHDPRTSQQTRELMARVNESANPEARRLQRKVLAGTGIRRQAVQSLLFHALRGLALSHLMLSTLPDHRLEAKQVPEQRKLLAEALGLLIEAQAAHKS